MTDYYDIAIIGIGAAGKMHAAAIEGIGEATLVAGSCRTEKKGRAFAEEFDCQWYPTYEEMLDERRPDIVTVCTPSGAHLGPVRAAAERGIDILCEKPLEITTERVDEMLDIVDEADISLGGVFQQRFNPVVRTIHDAAAAGRFGTVSVANAYVPWWRDDEYYGPTRWQGTQALDGGGALMNQAIHMIDAIQWIAGASMGLDSGENPVDEVVAYTADRVHGTEVEDTAVAVMRYRNGALGQLLGATSMYPGSLRRLHIGGRDGTAEISEEELTTWQFRDERSEDVEIRERFTESETRGGAADPTDVDTANHRRNIVAFLDAIVDDDAYLLNGREARKSVAIIESIYESAELGRPVLVE